MKQILLYSICLFGKATFWKKLIFQKSNIPHYLLFLDSCLFIATTFSKDATFYSSYLFRRAAFLQHTFAEELLFHGYGFTLFRITVTQNSLGNTCTRVSFLAKLQTLAKVFSCGFYEISKNILLDRTSLVTAFIIKGNGNALPSFFLLITDKSLTDVDFFIEDIKKHQQT